MARCIAKFIANERHRWETMDDRQLFQRLQKITVPEKLACFLHIAANERRGTLFRDGVVRCNSLGFSAIEETPGWFNVVPESFPLEVDRDSVDVVALRNRYTSRSPSTSESATSKSSTVDEDIEKFKKRGPEKKKKSLYSRKLRVKRRK